MVIRRAHADPAPRRDRACTTRAVARPAGAFASDRAVSAGADGARSMTPEGLMPHVMKDALATQSPGRRRFLAGAVGLAAAPLVSLRGGAQAGAEPRLVEAVLAPALAKVQLVPEAYPATTVWAYNGAVPGPTLRLRQGDRLRVRVENGLGEGTTVHWHGIRLPNAMDGVPDLTQPLIEPRQSFQYEFSVPDAGTYWYHPHQRSYEQIGRGLAGALIVE